MKAPEPYLAAIDIFGASATPEEKLLAELGLQEGQLWRPELLEPAWERLAQAIDLLDLRLTPVHYGDARVFLTVDVVELGQKAPAWRQPQGAETPARLAEVLGRYNETREAFWKLNQPVEERVSPEGHFESVEEALLRIERQAAALLDAQLDAALAAARDSHDEELRAGLVYMLGWASDKARVVAALLGALRDESAWVRNNAARALLPLALRAARQGDIALPPAPLIELLALPSAGDRARAVTLLRVLAESPAARRVLEAEARGALRAMARLRQPNNRAPAQALLAQLALDGQPEIALAQEEPSGLSALAEALLHAPDAAAAAELAEPDPAAPAHRQLAESVFTPTDEATRAETRLHSARPLDAERVLALLEVRLITQEGARTDGLGIVARRRAEGWRLWSVGDEWTPSQR